MGEIETEIDHSILQCIDLILAHKKEFVYDFLKKKDYPTSGTKEVQRERLRKLVATGEINKLDLLTVLDECERFGNQHIYLFRIAEPNLVKLRNSAYVKKVFKEIGLDRVYNAQTPCVIPEKSQVISITHNKDWLNICWATKKVTLELRSTKRVHRSNREFCIKEYLITKFRDLVIFRVYLVSGDAELMIHQLPRGSRYDEEKEPYLKQLDDWFKFGILTNIGLQAAIKKLENSDKVRVRNLGFRTDMGSQIEFVSASIDQGIYEDPDARNARKNIRSGLGNATNCYWLTSKSQNVLIQELRTRIYADRIAFTRQCRQEEVDYVLAGLRNSLD
jgi:hypothetical protein